MTIYPAIDIKDGRCVRLYKGRADRMTDYGEPGEAAERWQAQGAEWLHLVDLDGAFSGQGENLEAVRRITERVGVPVQLGGGIRAMADIADRLEKRGVARVILGTAALENPELVRQACGAYPGRIACGIDARNGMAAVRGWVDDSRVSSIELALRMRDAGIRDIIYTDISRDGTLAGPNIAATAALIHDSGLSVIASGGVSALEDIEALREIGCAGAICGRALYAGAFSLGAAIERAR